MRNEYLLHAGLPEKQMLKRRGASRTSVWECPGSVPTEGGGRMQRGQREPQHAPNLGLGQLHRDIWSYSGPAELSRVETREPAFIPLCWSVDMGCPWREVRPRTRQYSPGEAVPKGPTAGGPLWEVCTAVGRIVLYADVESKECVQVSMTTPNTAELSHAGNTLTLPTETGFWVGLP